MSYEISPGQVSSGIILADDSMIVEQGGIAESTVINDSGSMGVGGIARETTVGYKRIVLTSTTTTPALRLVIDDALATPTLTRVALYNDTIYCASR